MNHILVEKGIKVPTYMPPNSKYPWWDMEVGDSFFLPLPEGVTKRHKYNCLTQCVRNYRARFLINFRISAHKCEMGGVAGMRVWRIS